MARSRGQGSKDLFLNGSGPVRAVNGVISTVGEDEGDILDRVDHPRGRRECLVSAATCMSWLGMRDSVPRTGIWE